MNRSALLFATVMLVSASPALSQGIAHDPTPRNIGAWLHENYPASALIAHAEGYTAFVLTIQANGHPSDCRIKQSSGNADLDKAACDVFIKGQFNPAVDDTGKKVAGELSGGMHWKLPR